MGTEQKPFDDKNTDPEHLRDKQVVKEPTGTFDERTKVTRPWLADDGTQINGAEDVRQEVVATPKAGEKTRAQKATDATKKS